MTVTTIANDTWSRVVISRSVIESEVKSRLKALNAFQQLAAEPRTLGMHRALEGNVWISGDEYEVLKSNVTLESVVKRLTDRVYQGGRGQEQPDLLLVGSSGRYLLRVEATISHTIVHEDVAAQAQKYRRRVGRFRNITIGDGGAWESNPPSNRKLPEQPF